MHSLHVPERGLRDARWSVSGQHPVNMRVNTMVNMRVNMRVLGDAVLLHLLLRALDAILTIAHRELSQKT